LKTRITVNIENTKAVKTARVAYISGLKPLSFTLTARSYNFFKTMERGQVGKTGHQKARSDSGDGLCWQLKSKKQVRKMLILKS
jgi:hypothetical protein